MVIELLRENWPVLLVVVGLVTTWLLLRTPGTELASTEEFDWRVSSGRPVVVEFYTNA